MKNSRKLSDMVVVREIGQGQFSQVYLVKDAQTGKEYAMKKANKEKIIKNSTLLRLFKTEVSILKKINHPHILHCFFRLEDARHFYLVVNYCNQGDLDAYIKANGPIFERKALLILKQLCCAFIEMHDHKIMHRDFKPANVFLHEGAAIIGDFGFARTGTDLGETALGTPLYSSPEVQAASGDSPYTNLSDLWSLGMTFYKMLFGCEPWKVFSTVDLYNKSTNMSGSKLPFPQSPKVSEETKNLLRRMVEPDPARRMTWHELFHSPLVQADIKPQEVPGTNPLVVENTNKLFHISQHKASREKVDFNIDEFDESFFSQNTHSMNPLVPLTTRDDEWDRFDFDHEQPNGRSGEKRIIHAASDEGRKYQDLSYR